MQRTYSVIYTEIRYYVLYMLVNPCLIEIRRNSTPPPSDYTHAGCIVLNEPPRWHHCTHCRDWRDIVVILSPRPLSLSLSYTYTHTRIKLSNLVYFCLLQVARGMYFRKQ